MAEGKDLSVAEVRRTIAASLAAAFGFVIALILLMSRWGGRTAGPVQPNGS